ncbi:MAG: cofactor-independent phosphoglycerate mutase [Lachnospiraceae bacterium]|nr:cofactor-independent phosphoglycerate mutase [Lachnospiraceae bacterium]
MKYIIVLGDGMADLPIKELNNQTPLQAAKTPNMDWLAARSELGLAHTIPEGMKPGSDVANLAVLGYNPAQYYSGRSPLEALSIGVDMKPTDIALRTNIITVSDEDGIPFEERTIIDHSSGEISTEDAEILLNACREELENDEFKFYTGTSYRHLCIWDKGSVVNLAQPHDHLEEKAGPYLPDESIAGGAVRRMVERSFEILNHHPINEKRRAEGKNVANALWFWGAGTRPALDSFEEKTGLKGAMISAVDLLKGIAVGTGMKVVQVDGANALLETNYEGKAQAALDVLLKDNYDFVYIHVEAPDEMGHQGSYERKIKAIEYIDGRLIGPLLAGLEGEEFRMLVMPDHPTPIAVRTHTSDPVPFMIYDSRKERKEIQFYNEEDAAKTGLVIDPGYKTVNRLLEI